MQIPSTLQLLITSDPEIVGGAPFFAGTHGPKETVVDNLEGGHGVQEILCSYPSLRVEHIKAVLDWEWILPKKRPDFSSNNFEGALGRNDAERN